MQVVVSAKVFWWPFTLGETSLPPGLLDNTDGKINVSQITYKEKKKKKISSTKQPVLGETNCEFTAII